MLKKEANPLGVAPKTQVQFTKRRTDPLAGNPARAVFAVRERRSAWAENNDDDGAGGGTFLTGVDAGSLSPSNRNNNGGIGIGAGPLRAQGPPAKSTDFFLSERRKAAERAKERQLKMKLTEGQQKLRNRMKDRGARESVERTNDRKHEEAVRRMDQHKRENVSVRRSVVPTVKATKGASSGIRTNNKAMRQFQDIKNEHQRRKDAIVRRVPPGGARGGSLTAAVTSLPQQRGAAGIGVIGKKEGLTRKSNTMPVRRKVPGQLDQQPMGGVAVGVGGIRALRDRRANAWA